MAAQPLDERVRVGAPGVDHAQRLLRQRAFIFTLLQYLARSSADVPADPVDGEDAAGAPATPAPNLILAIEEPELYQQGR